MYLDPIHWVMDNSGLRLLQRESEKGRQKKWQDQERQRKKGKRGKEEETKQIIKKQSIDERWKE